MRANGLSRTERSGKNLLKRSVPANRIMSDTLGGTQICRWLYETRRGPPTRGF